MLCSPVLLRPASGRPVGGLAGLRPPGHWVFGHCGVFLLGPVQKFSYSPTPFFKHAATDPGFRFEIPLFVSLTGYGVPRKSDNYQIQPNSGIWLNVSLHACTV